MTTMEKKRSYIFKVVPYVLEYKWRVLFSLALIITARGFSVANPYIIKKVIDLLVEGAPYNLFFVGILIALFFIFRWGMDLLSGIKDYVFAKVDISIKRKIPLDVFKHLLYLPVDFHTEQATGGVSRKVSRGTSSLSTISFFFTGSILPTFIEILMIVVVFLTTFPISFSLVFLLFVIAYVAYTVVVAEKRQKLLLEANRRDDRGGEQSIDALTNFETVKYFTNEEYELKRYNETLGRWSDIAILSTKKGANLNMGQGFIITAGLTALLILATREFIQGSATIGDFVLITSYLNRIAIPLTFLGTIYRRLKEALANIDAMFKLFDIKSSITDRKGATVLNVKEGNIILKDVEFSYQSDRKILKKISIDFPAKKSTAIVGYSGSGKSTVSKLLLRFYDVDKGSIRIDGVDIRDVTQDSLRKEIGVVAQDTILFNDTILHNINYGDTDATKEAIEKAAKLANIHDFIMGLPDSYDTAVGERGLKLSGGEKQRVAIARMMLKNPDILLFDEATASLDSKSERMIQESIKYLSKEGKTTIAIAHRLSTIIDFDKIIVMEKGEVIEEGTHDALLKTCGAYQRLWSMQKG